MEIQEIKQHLSIGAILSFYNLKMNKNKMLSCPFHNDKTPSMQVYESTNTVFCFSANCSTHGKSLDVIDFIKYQESCTKREAILKAQAMTNQAPIKEENQTPITKKGIFLRFWQSCKEGIKRSPKANQYLKSRGLEAGEIGYCSEKSMKNWSSELQEKAREFGLITEKNRPHFSNCVVFPLKDKNGFVSGFYGRSINAKGHFYLKGEREGIFPKYPNSKTERLILTESIIDACSVPKGKEVIALFGTNGLTEEIKEAIQNLQELKEIVLFFDGDSSGEKASLKYKEILQELQPKATIKIIETPKDEDINSLLINNPNKLKELLLSTEKEKKVEEKVKTLFNSENEKGLEYITETGNYTIVGGLDLKERSAMKVSLFIANPQILQNILGRMQPIIYRTSLNLFESKQIAQISKAASERVSLRADLLERDLNEFTAVLENYRTEKNAATQEEKPQIQVDKSLESKALAFLKKPTFLKDLNKLIEKSGVVGEENSRLCLFVIASTYKMKDTLHALIQGSSGSGKTHLLIKISALMPQEDVIYLTRITESSLYNYGENELSNKLFNLEDMDGLKEEAFLAFRELQSRGMISTSTSGKDESGQIKSFVKTVKGPISSLSCTTRGAIYEDNMSRCFLIAVDESKQQTSRVIERQNQESAGKTNKKEELKIQEFIQTCLRLIKPLEVINPFADKIELPKEAHKIRRLNDLFQRFVRQITLLHQHQRKHNKQGQIITEIVDIEQACEIMFESIMLKVDELDGSLRTFYEDLKVYVKQQSKGENPSGFSFGQREIRQEFNLSKSQLQRYLRALRSYEYISQVDGFRNRGFKYQIIYWDSLEALKGRIRKHLTDQIEKLK